MSKSMYPCRAYTPKGPDRKSEGYMYPVALTVFGEVLHGTSFLSDDIGQPFQLICRAVESHLHRTVGLSERMR